MYRLIFSKLYKEDVDSSYNYIKDKLEALMAADNIFYIISSDNKSIKVVRFLYKKRNWINILKEEMI
jgi:plasmid stabilization system protein ParE